MIKMMGELKIFLEHYKRYNEIKLVEAKKEDDQAVFFGYIKAIEAVQNMVLYLEEQE